MGGHGFYRIRDGDGKQSNQRFHRAANLPGREAL